VETAPTPTQSSRHHGSYGAGACRDSGDGPLVRAGITLRRVREQNAVAPTVCELCNVTARGALASAETGSTTVREALLMDPGDSSPRDSEGIGVPLVQ
jgi:hypothetical protein